MLPDSPIPFISSFGKAKRKIFQHKLELEKPEKKPKETQSEKSPQESTEKEDNSED